MTQTLFSPFISLCRVNRKLQTAPPYCARPPLEAVNSIFPLSCFSAWAGFCILGTDQTNKY